MLKPLAYYNENDPKAAAWLRELIRDGHIANGFVDDRSILDVRPADLASFTQCHFFAGIGGWSYALRLAGWDDSRPVWTGSCPCQPFSAAGKGGGFADERHLWPAWFHLIEQCRPSVIFGEQVASKDGLNWFDLVQSDLEGANYAVGAADLCAAGVGAPHIRQRMYFVGDASGQRQSQRGIQLWEPQPAKNGVRSVSTLAGRSETSGTGSRRDVEKINPFDVADSNMQRKAEPGHRETIGRCWKGAEFIPCTDGKARPIEPGTFPLAYGVPGRVGLLRGYGNAIVPQVAAEFIGAYLDAS